MRKDLFKGIAPNGKEWHFVAWLESGWDIYARDEYNGFHVVKIVSTVSREKKANFFVAWDSKTRKYVKGSVGTNTGMQTLKRYYPELKDAVYYELFASDIWETMKPMTAEQYRKVSKIKGIGHLGARPNDTKFHKVDSFDFCGWELWIKETSDEWVNIKMVSTILRTKANYYLSWNYRQNRFAVCPETEKLKADMELYDHLVKFLKEE